MKRRDFLVGLGAVGGVLPSLARAQVPCPPPRLEVDGGTSVLSECQSGAVDVPYALPTSGQAIAISVPGGNHALSVAPPGWGSGDWDYSSFGSFGGGAFVPKYSGAGAYVVAGSGGHNHPDHVGALIFDFSTGMWTRLDNANGVALKSAYPYSFSVSEGNGAPWHEIGGTPVPLPPHPYACMAYSPDGAKGSIIHVTKSAVGRESTISQCAHRFDLATRMWSRASTGPSGRADYESDSLWDEARNRWWLIINSQQNYNNVTYLDRVDQTFKTTSSFASPPSSIEGYARVMLHNGLIVRNCGASKGLFLFDPDSPSSGWIKLTVSGTLPNSSNRWARYSNGNWYSMPSGGGNVLSRIVPPSNPKTGTWTVGSITVGGASMPSGQRGYYSGLNHYTRLFYVQAIDCLAWVPGGSLPVQLIKPI